MISGAVSISRSTLHLPDSPKLLPRLPLPRAEGTIFFVGPSRQSRSEGKTFGKVRQSEGRRKSGGGGTEIDGEEERRKATGQRR